MNVFSPKQSVAADLCLSGLLAARRTHLLDNFLPFFDTFFLPSPLLTTYSSFV